jgi:hypothetical protein
LVRVKARTPLRPAEDALRSSEAVEPDRRFATIGTVLAARARQTGPAMIDVAPVVCHWPGNHWRGHLNVLRTASGLAVKKRGALPTGDGRSGA